MVTACGSGDNTTFESVDDLRSDVESADYECGEVNRRPIQSDMDDGFEEILCTEGYLLTVWDEDFEPDTQSAATDTFVREQEEQGLIEHLRGENWHVTSVDGDMLEDLQQRFGGELNEVSFPVVDE